MRLPCKATKPDGSPCRSPVHLVNQETGLCRSHDPALVESIRAAGRKGGAATIRRFRQEGLEESDLPPLETHEDVMQWLETLGRAVATGRIHDKQCTATTRAIEVWLKAFSEGATAKELDALKKKLHEVKQLRKAS